MFHGDPRLVTQLCSVFFSFSLKDQGQENCREIPRVDLIPKCKSGDARPWNFFHLFSSTFLGAFVSMVLGAWTRLRKKNTYFIKTRNGFIVSDEWSILLFTFTESPFFAKMNVQASQQTVRCCHSHLDLSKATKKTEGNGFIQRSSIVEASSQVNKRGKRYHSDLKTDSCKWYTLSDKLSSVSHNGMVWIGVFQELRWWREKMVLAYKSDEINTSKSSKCWSLKILVDV